MKIVIDLELTPAQKRVVRMAVVAGTVIASLGLGVAVATPKHAFTSGTPVRASDMNDNFNDLDTRVSALQSGAANALHTRSAGWQVVAAIVDGTASTPRVLGTGNPDYAPDGGWISSVTRPGGAGGFGVHTQFASSTPGACTVTAASGNPKFATWGGDMANISVSIANATGTNENQVFSIICFVQP
jgi:hypothetical protein